MTSLDLALKLKYAVSLDDLSSWARKGHILNAYKDGHRWCFKRGAVEEALRLIAGERRRKVKGRWQWVKAQ